MAKQKLVVATGNAHKLKEISEILSDFEIVSQRDAGFDEEVEETGETFLENALLKAEAACKALSLPAIADDSWLCLNALGGAPGVYSARYAGGHGDDAANRRRLLNNLEGKSDRTAYFSCALALVYPNGEKVLAEGRTNGKILYEERGNGGFGYDCLFFSDDLQKSFGEATAEEKNAVSHRFRALTVLGEKLRAEGRI